MENLKIIWAKQARNEVNNIYNYYKKKSEQGAKNVRSDLLKSPKTIRFSKQYQIDEINPNYRRIIVRDFKVLYKEVNGIIRIMDIVSTRQSPELLMNK